MMEAGSPRGLSRAAQQSRRWVDLGNDLDAPWRVQDIKQASSSIDDGQIGQIEAIIRSMTPSERNDPSAIDGPVGCGSPTAAARPRPT